jgi:hypothetical protein
MTGPAAPITGARALCALILALAPAVAHAAPALIGDYLLATGSFTNAVTGAQALGSLSVVASSGSTGFVTGTASDAGWFWSGATAPGTGLSLSGLPLNTGSGPGAAFGDYSIGMRFQFSNTVGFRRMINFADEDSGMYVNTGVFAFFGSEGLQGGSITANTFVEFILTRTGSNAQVAGYVNGSSTPVFQFTDSSALADVPSGSPLNFFRDDPGGSEFSPAGRISMLRVWDGPLSPAEIPMAMVPEPSALALGGLSVATILLGARRWRCFRAR